MELGELVAAEVINRRDGAGLVLVCEHASPFIPDELDGLGLATQEQRATTAADSDMADVAERLSTELGAPLVLGQVSRLVIDCARRPDCESSILVESGVRAIPGNRDITDEERASRLRSVFDPFHRVLGEALESAGPDAALVALHAFAPDTAEGQAIEEIGVLPGPDPSLARALVEAAPACSMLHFHYGRPFSGACGGTHSLERHCSANGRPSACIAVRSDLIASPVQQSMRARTLSSIIGTALQHA